MVSLMAICKINIPAESLLFLINLEATVNGLPLAVVSMRLYRNWHLMSSDSNEFK